MKLLLTILFAVLALNALVIAVVAGILIFDHHQAKRRKRGAQVREEDAHAETP